MTRAPLDSVHSVTPIDSILLSFVIVPAFGGCAISDVATAFSCHGSIVLLLTSSTISSIRFSVGSGWPSGPEIMITRLSAPPKLFASALSSSTVIAGRNFSVWSRSALRPIMNSFSKKLRVISAT